MKPLLYLLLSLCLSLPFVSQRGYAQLSAVRAQLERSQAQEKVYLHLDNNCYFLGDTIWYKSYVVRADDHRYTDMSRLVYVELVTPDGMVVERQKLIASSQGFGDGCFALRDTLYSGYYELRAYTRWMLNFCVTQHPHHKWDEEQFYSPDMARDFFREYGAISRRVVPVFEKPERAGEYGYRFMKERPKRRLPVPPKPKLNVSFYPEGGHIVAGQPCRVAFEATDQLGQAVHVEGRVITAQGSQRVATTYQGRGAFWLTAAKGVGAEAEFSYQGHTYTFRLPAAVSDGCALQILQEPDSIIALISPQGAPARDSLLVVDLCRGRLQVAEAIGPGSAQPYRLAIAKRQLTTGVNNLLVLDAEGRPLADRLFFVNLHDHSPSAISMTGSTCRDLDPLQPVTMTFQAPPDAHHLSIAVRDAKTDETTYDTGNILTDLLLSSELQGFVPHPDYYFADTSSVRQQALDLLMLVQGWRRYDYQALVSADTLRYQPEVSFTVEGMVGRTIDFVDADVSIVLADMEQQHQSMDSTLLDERGGGVPDAPRVYQHPSPLRHEVEVIAELVLADEVGEVSVPTFNNGHFAFEVPPFFGQAILFLRAHGIGKKPSSRDVSDRFDEHAWPDYYVKRNLFYPVFAQPYNYYQCHLPDVDGQDDDQYRYWLEDASSRVRISAMDAVLPDVDVTALLRRGSRVQDLNHPVFTMDAYDLFNLTCDYGLESGRFHYADFAHDICTLLFGSYDASGRSAVVQRRLDADIDGDYHVGDEFYQGGEVRSYQSNYTLINNTQLKRMDQVRVYSDFDLRSYDTPLQRSSDVWDVLVKFVLLPGEGERRSYRDRRIQLQGIHMPTAFYQPDYSHLPLPDSVSDYRRTLYWNANAPLDADGCCTVQFYNNSTARRLHLSVAGLTADGHPVTLEK